MLIFGVHFETGQNHKKIAEALKGLEDLKKKQEALQRVYKAGEISQDHYIEETIILKERVAELTQTQKENQRVIDNVHRAQKAAIGSVNQLKAEAALLTDQWNALSREERKAAKGKDLQDKLKSVNEELAKTGAQVGDFRRFVGQYKAQIEAAFAGNSKFGESFQALSDVLNLAREGGALFLNTIKSTTVATEAQTVATTTQTAAANVGTKAWKLFKIAVAATGIGLLLIAATALYQVFLKTESGALILERGFNSIGAVVSVITERLKIFGQAAIELLSGNFQKALDLTKKGYTGIGDQIERQVKLTDQLTIARHRLERVNIDNIATNKKLLNEIEKLKNIRDDEFNSIIKRAGANKQAYDLEIKRLNVLGQIAKENLTLRIEELSQGKNITKEQLLQIKNSASLGTLTGEQLDLLRVSKDERKEIRELENELADIQEDSAGKQNEFIAARYSLEQARLEAIHNNKLGYIQAELIRAEVLASDKVKIEQEALKLQLHYDLSNAKIGRGERLKIYAQYLTDIDTLEKNHRKQKKEAQDRENQTTLNDILTATNLTFDKAEAELKARLAAGEFAGETELDGLTEQERYEQALLETKKNRLESELLVLQDYAGRVIGAEQLIANKQIELSNLVADSKIEAAQKVTDETKIERDKQIKLAVEQAAKTQAFIDGITQAFEGSLTEQGINLQEFSKNVLFVVLDTLEKTMTAQVTAGILGVTVGALNTPDSYLTAGASGLAKAAVMAGLIKAAFTLAKAGISSALSSGPSVGFADGGFTGDGFGSPDNTGFKPAGIVHQDEWVAPAWMTKNPEIKPVLQGLENIRLKGFADGGFVNFNRPSPLPANFYNDGGIGRRWITSQAMQNQSFDQSALGNLIAMHLNAAVANLPNPVVDVVSIERQTKKKKRAEVKRKN